MKRIILMVAYNILLVPVMWFKLCYYARHVEKYTEEERYKMLRFIDSRAIKGGRITIDVHGQENIPKEDGFMFFPNHQGLFDVLAIMHACPRPFSVVMKKEVQNIPFLKQVFACMKAYAIDRDDVRQSMQVILQVAKEVKEGRNYLIFPEGTRTKDPNNVHDFKGGSFKSATKAKCPIVPIALIDSYKSFDTKSIERVTVQVHILKPMLYEEYKDMKTVEIAAEVKSRIEKVIKKTNKKGLSNATDPFNLISEITKGVIPVVFLNMAMKWLESVKPLCLAISCTSAWGKGEKKLFCLVHSPMS